MRPLVLIVDDQLSMRQNFSGLLQGWGMETVAAKNNTLALAQAQARPPQLITTDMFRPGGTGLEFIREIRALPGFSSVPIIFSSASALEEDGLRAEQMGAIVIPKFSPLMMQKLYAVVQGITKIDSDMGQVSLEAAVENLDSYVRHSMNEGAEEYLFDAELHLGVATDAGKDTSKHYKRLRELKRQHEREEGNSKDSS